MIVAMRIGANIIMLTNSHATMQIRITNKQLLPFVNSKLITFPTYELSLDIVDQFLHIYIYYTYKAT